MWKYYLLMSYGDFGNHINLDIKYQLLQSKKTSPAFKKKCACVYNDLSLIMLQAVYKK